MNVIDRSVRGKPYQAEYEQIQTKKSINRGETRVISKGRFFRATDGRLRKEYSHSLFSGKEIRIVTLINPSTDDFYLLSPDDGMGGASGQPLNGGCESNNVTHTISTMSSFSEHNHNDLTIESSELGERVFEGLYCRGSRSRLVACGATIEILESWYCEEIDERIFERRSWQGEERIERLYNIRLIEPDIRLFEIPSDCRLLASSKDFQMRSMR